MSPKHILVAVDESKHSETVLNFYLKNFYVKGDSLLLLHVIQPAIISVGFSASVVVDEKCEEVLTKEEEKARKLLKKYMDLCEEYELKIRALIEPGKNPGEVIVGVAEKNNVDMIVMGSRGLGLLRRTLEGSSSDYVLNNVHIPLTVVPTSEE